MPDIIPYPRPPARPSSRPTSPQPSRKIIRSDWNWQYNRSSTGAAIWHNESGDLREVILWRDGYVEFDKFPPDS